MSCPRWKIEVSIQRILHLRSCAMHLPAHEGRMLVENLPSEALGLDETRNRLWFKLCKCFAEINLLTKADEHFRYVIVKHDMCLVRASDTGDLCDTVEVFRDVLERQSKKLIISLARVQLNPRRFSKDCNQSLRDIIVCEGSEGLCDAFFRHTQHPHDFNGEYVVRQGAVIVSMIGCDIFTISEDVPFDARDREGKGFPHVAKIQAVNISAALQK